MPAGARQEYVLAWGGGNAEGRGRVVEDVGLPECEGKAEKEQLVRLGTGRATEANTAVTASA